MTEPSMQLWTDDSSNEFAIFLNSKYVIRTNQSANYTKVIDESPCMQGYTYDWKHTLSHWVNYHFGNQVTVKIANASTVDNSKTEFLYVQTLKGPDSKLKTEAKVRRLHLTYFDHPKNKSESKAKIKPKTEALKCHYCNLKYFLDEERKEHEKLRHSTTT
jgi:hypothetical protein